MVSFSLSHTISFKGNAGQWLLRNLLNREIQNCGYCYSCHHSFQNLFVVSACFWMSVCLLVCRIKCAHFQGKGCLSNISEEYMHHNLSTWFCFCERWYYSDVFELVKLCSVCNSDREIKLRMKEFELLLFSYGTVWNWGTWGNNPSWHKIYNNREQHSMVFIILLFSLLEMQLL